MEFVWFILGVCFLILIAAVFSYNRFVEQRNLIRDSWANVQTELQRRYDLIPNLVETVKGYAKHERELFESITEARSRASRSTGRPADQAHDEGPLITGLRQLLAVSEAYPDLKASSNFLELQHELANTEDRLQAARRFYNSNVREFNRRVDSIPSNVVAATFDFEAADYFEIEAAVATAGPPTASFQN